MIDKSFAMIPDYDNRARSNIYINRGSRIIIYLRFYIKDDHTQHFTQAEHPSSAVKMRHRIS